MVHLEEMGGNDSGSVPESLRAKSKLVSDGLRFRKDDDCSPALVLSSDD